MCRLLNYTVHYSGAAARRRTDSEAKANFQGLISQREFPFVMNSEFAKGISGSEDALIFGIFSLIAASLDRLISADKFCFCRLLLLCSASLYGYICDPENVFQGGMLSY